MTKMVNTALSINKKVKIGMVGKYVELRDAYLSVAEALTHGGIGNEVKVDIEWIDSEEIDAGNVEAKLGHLDGVLVPGGFGQRGVEGKITAIEYVRTHNIPFFGICLGMQLAVVEYCRNVLGLADANSAEFDMDSKNHMIDYA